MSDTHALQVAIVIPVHNGRHFTDTCLTRIEEQQFTACRVIVIDDGSTDGTAEMIRQHHSSAEVISGDGSLWWTGSADLGCRVAFESSADIVILLNNDNVDLSPNLVDELREQVVISGGCVGALVYRADGDGPAYLFNAGGVIDWRRRGFSLRRQIDEEPTTCDWLPGCALAFSRNLYEAVRGFDARLFPQYRGDIDFTLRARKAGFSCVVTPNAWVLNDARQTGLRIDRQISLRDALSGFFSKRSNYNLRESVRFALRHCPPLWLAPHLVQFYGRYVYACARSRRHAMAAH
jgi:GT2 family glycosyltransferase